jgi:hypothetical protein
MAVKLRKEWRVRENVLQIARLDLEIYINRETGSILIED